MLIYQRVPSGNLTIGNGHLVGGLEHFPYIGNNNPVEDARRFHGLCPCDRGMPGIVSFQSGFPTHGPAVTLVKFQEETASFYTQQTQGLKSGITHMLHVWYIYLRLYR